MKYFIFSFLIFASTSVSALEISEIPNESRLIFIGGVIQKGDAAKIDSYLINNKKGAMYINSPGGDVIEAIAVANVVEKHRIGVLIPQGANCVSACFFIFLAGNGRTASGTLTDGQRPAENPLGYIGIHRPYLKSPDGKIPSQSNQTMIMRQVTAYLDYQMVPRRLVDLMMSRPSNDVYWLSDEDIKELGEFPPALEELYISKCDYNRNLQRQWAIANASGNTYLATQLWHKIIITSKCIAGFTGSPVSSTTH